MKSVYIHIPFCNNICTYCDFPKVLNNVNMVDEYLSSLENEIATKYNGEAVLTLYIGGGTPSCLNSSQLDKLIAIINQLNLVKIIEFTFECNIDDISESLLNILKKIGVTRLSIGIQSFNNNKLSFLGRSVNFPDADIKIKLIRSLGFNNINLDIMFGIPNEKLLDLKQDINKILKLKPDHISAYSLIIEPNTMIASQEPINDELEYKMYQYIEKKLKNNKYEHYEISSYSLNKKQSIHNLTYWSNEEYYGFGLGAHGYIEGFRYENTRSLTDYINKRYCLKENLLAKQEIMENEVMLGLRLIKGINLQNFYDKYNYNLQDVFPIKPLLKSKELLHRNGNVFINPKYIYVMNEILLKLI